MLFEMINQVLKAQETKYQVLSNFDICCRELGRLKVANFRACVRNVCCATYVSNYTDTPPRFANCLSNMTLKIKLCIKDHTKVLVLSFPHYYIIS